jgi:large subunit ribosomal protein L13
MKTALLSKEAGLKSRNWVLIDACGVPLGRLASKVASILRGKNKPSFTPHVNCGDFVVVINASQVKLTGKKRQNKEYRDYTGFPGGLKTVSVERLMSKRPGEIIERAVQGMLPSGPLGYAMIRKLKVYAGAEHPHKAQVPQTV